MNCTTSAMCISLGSCLQFSFKVYLGLSSVIYSCCYLAQLPVPACHSMIELDLILSLQVQ